MLPVGWTIGCELELSDAERDRPLPPGCTWDRKDYTIVNSNGVANDPLGLTWRFGGEVTTRPTDEVVDQINVIDAVLNSCTPAATANYRSNFHINIRVPGLKDNLYQLKRLAHYTAENPPFDLVDPLPPHPGNNADPLAITRYKRRKQSHHTVLNARQLQNIEAATTSEGVRVAHAPLDKNGKPQYQLVQRPGVSLLSLWDTQETVEFRHFCLELDLSMLYRAMAWCQHYLEAALSNAPMNALWVAPRYPQQPLIDLELERGYRATSPRYHKRPDIIRYLTEKGLR